MLVDSEDEGGTVEAVAEELAKGLGIAESIESASKWGRFGGEGGRQRSALGLPLHAANPYVKY